MGSLADDCARGRTLIQTHISWVFLDGNQVWKVKKPVNFGFLDFSTLQKRRAACSREAELNARLCTNVYRGVVPVYRNANGQHSFEGPGEVVDYALSMRQLSEADRADVRLAQGTLNYPELDRLARALADFHARAETNPRIAAFGAPDAVQTNVLENFTQLEPALAQVLSASEQQSLRDAQLGYLERHAEAFQRRVNAGRVRDGHGDLRLEHVYLGEHLDIIDCIEFNDRFRYADVCADLAFLTMDLEHQERADLGEYLLGIYAREAGDYDLYELVNFYDGYRAMVRAKVAFLGTLGREPTPSEWALVRRYLVHALAAARPTLAPLQLVAVGGLIGSGKSTLAAELARLLACPAVDSDRTRKQLAGVAPTVSLASAAFAGNYSADATQRVYDEVLRRARLVLASGRSVILDASFSTRAARDKARTLAQELGAAFRFVECVTPREVALARVAQRSQSATPSDGNVEVYDDFAARFEPVVELEQSEFRRFQSGTPATSLAAGWLALPPPH